jgi:hypothetical protein
MGVRLVTCAPHRMLTDDQRALNGLLFARRMAQRLLGEEFSAVELAGSTPQLSLTPVAVD